MKKSGVLLAVISALLVTGSYAQTSTPTRGGNSNAKAQKTEQTTQSTAPGAGNSSSPQATADAWTQKMDDVLHLTPDQKQRISAINLKYANQLEDLKNRYHSMDNPDMTQAKADKDKITEARINEYSGILNADQMQKFNDHRDKMKSDSGNKAQNKDEMKQNMQNMTPEERQQYKDQMKEKKQNKQSGSSSTSSSDNN